MSMSIGGVDLGSAVINSEYRIAVLEKIVERLANRVGGLSTHDIERFRDEAFANMQTKYPDAGLRR